MACIGAELVHLVGHSPSFGEEVELKRIQLLQTFQVLGQESFASDLIHGWEVVCLLVRLERSEFVRVNADVIPVNVELGVGVLTLSDTPIHVLLGHLFNQGVLGL